MDINFTTILYILALYIAYWFGKQAAMWRFMSNLSKDPDNAIKMVEAIKVINQQVEEHDMPEDAIEVTVEQVNDLVYAYNKVTGEFLAQAQNLHQVMTLAEARYPDKKFWHPELTKDTQTT